MCNYEQKFENNSRQSATCSGNMNKEFSYYENKSLS